MYIVFFVAALLLTAVAIFGIASAMLRHRPVTGDRRQSNIEIAKQRIAELEHQQAEGLIGDADADQLRQEIEIELLRDVESIDHAEGCGDKAAQGRASRRGVIAVAMIMPIAAGALYLAIGDPGAITQPQTHIVQGEQNFVVTDPSGRELTIEEITATLEERVQQVPDDTRAWLSLAQTYIVQQQFSAGADAFAELRKVQGDRPEILIREADARALAQGGDFAGEPERLLKQALSIDPGNPAALWLVGLAASARQEYRVAMDYWNRAQAEIEDPQVRAELMQVMQETQALIDAEASSPAQAPDLASIDVMVSIDPDVARDFEPETTVFILARASDGPAMPLAVIKRKIGDLPLQVTLDDSMAMLPSRKLSDFNSVEIVARASISGNAMPASGDAFGQAASVIPGQAETVQLEIAELVP